jgi:phage repressor protein C with HTH and peptisase S24 domain
METQTVNRRFFDKKLSDKGLSQRELAARMELDPAQITRVFQGKRKLTPTEIGKMADLLEVPTEVILRNIGVERLGPRPVADGAFEAQPKPVNLIKVRYLPVYGCAAGCATLADGAFELNGQAMDYIPAPPSLANVKNAYSVKVAGDSMTPRFNDGDLAIVNPQKSIQPGRAVIIQIAGDQLADAPLAYIKEFVRATADKIIVKQYNPEKTIEFDRRQVVAAHRVVGVWEE